MSMQWLSSGCYRACGTSLSASTASTTARRSCRAGLMRRRRPVTAKAHAVGPLVLSVSRVLGEAMVAPGMLNSSPPTLNVTGW